MSLEPIVHWREGMFLCPQHMQAFARELGARVHRGESVGRPGSHGLLSIQVNETELAQDVFLLDRAEIVFGDGTLANFPLTATVEKRSFAEHFTGTELDVYLGIASRRENIPVVEEGSTEARYEVYPKKQYDENIRDSERQLEFRKIVGRLFFGDEKRGDYECVHIARLIRVGRPEPHSELCPTFVPPILACGASQVLVRRMKKITAGLRAQARDLSTRVPSMSALSSVEKGADISGLIKLQAVNSCLGGLEQLARVGEIHPFDAYVWLANAIGELSIFGGDRVCPDLPPYDQDSLTDCFDEALRVLEALTLSEVAVPYDTANFQKDPMREGFYIGTIPTDWLEGHPMFYLGVEMGVEPEKIVELVAGGVKLVPEGEIERVLQGVVPGIAMTHVRQPPMAFPKPPGQHYFKIETEGVNRALWQLVLQERKAIVLSTLGAMGEVRFGFYVELVS